MSIGKRICKALEELQNDDPEAALFQVCSAVEATAKAEVGGGGGSTYKTFIHENLGLITKAAFGVKILNLNLKFRHPQIKPSADGTCSIEQVLYHAVRCGLYHEAQYPSDISFSADQYIKVDGDTLVLPVSLVLGLVVAVVTSPANDGESTESPFLLNMGPFPIPLSQLWGRRDECLWLLEVADELSKIQHQNQAAETADTQAN